MRRAPPSGDFPSLAATQGRPQVGAVERIGAAMAFVEAGGSRLEYERVGVGPADGPTVVMLHEGLGSVAMWRDFPMQVARATGLRVLVYSRRGYGKSDPVADLPLPFDYMHREAQEVLADLLRRLDVRRPVLLGHSDGASIALIYAGSGLEPAADSVIVMAPHVMIEPCTITSIAKARVLWEETDLRGRLARYHDDPDGAFYAWNLSWMMPEFRDWNIEEYLPNIRTPITVVQGLDDEYGSLLQPQAVERRAGGPVRTAMLPGCGHSPHRDRPEETLAAIVRHIRGDGAA